jgi:CspA family cold shock protein
MATGKVKSFDAKKGSGVIQMENGKDIVFQLEAIQGSPWIIEALEDGERVRVGFEIRQGPKGDYAVDIVKL